MKVKMLKTTIGCDEAPNGVNEGPKTYEAGQEYELGTSLADVFVNKLKVAELASEPSKAPQAPKPTPPLADPVDADQVQDPVEPTKENGAPENKGYFSGKQRKTKKEK